VVDSADNDRLEEAKEELMGMLKSHELKDAALLVFANKQDYLHAATVSKVVEQLGLEKEMGSGRPVYCQGSSATTGQGIYEGMEWLSQAIKK
jgi:signal recognition particle receptor subunit beta